MHFTVIWSQRNTSAPFYWLSRIILCGGYSNVFFVYVVSPTCFVNTSSSLNPDFNTSLVTCTVDTFSIFSKHHNLLTVQILFAERTGSFAGG